MTELLLVGWCFLGGFSFCGYLAGRNIEDSKVEVAVVGLLAGPLVWVISAAIGFMWLSATIAKKFND